ncbi:MAG: thioredoxin [Candidatus Methylacidiphilales bacterium]
MTTIFVALFFVINISSCQNNTNGTGGKLDVNTFEKNVNDDKNIQLIDVRTPGEYAEGFIGNAKNIDWNGDNFAAEVAKLDKTKPVYVYCLAGGRSASAANKLKEMGFSQVYDLKGGMNAWRNAAKPISVTGNEPAKPENTGLSLADFNKKIVDNQLVLVDVYAPWCGPCKKMAPYLAEIAEEKKDKLTFIKVNADESQEIVKNLNVEELPTLILYKNGKRVYTNIGLITKADLLKVIDTNISK